MRPPRLHAENHTHNTKETHLELSQALRIQCSNGLGEVTERSWVRQVQLLGRVIRYNPREHRVLREVVERAVRNTGAQQHRSKQAHDWLVSPHSGTHLFTNVR